MATAALAAAVPEGRLASGAPAVRTLGRTAYEPTWRAMQAFNGARARDTPDELWVTEHPPVYTLGLAGRREHVLHAGDIPVLKVDRGGQVTYHGPGQLVVYVLLDLRRRRATGVRALVRLLEDGVVEWLDSLGISAYGKPSAPGVYVTRGTGEAKIAALGLRVANGCTYHGLAVNVSMDLAPFAGIDPCGYRGLAVTQVAEFVPAPSLADAGDVLASILARSLTLA